jgi:hypothetical protein
MVMLITPASGWTSGGGNNNYQAGDCSCHTEVSTATVTMSASSTILSPGQRVTVTVTVKGGETVDRPLGVMIVSKLTGSKTLPTENGWKIVSDTWGTTYNYNEVTSYSGTAKFTWTLEAPQNAGSYSLYARMENSGSGKITYKDYAAGLSFSVQNGGSSGNTSSSNSTMVAIATPADGTTLTGNVTIDATVGGQGNNVSSAQLLIDGQLVEIKDTYPFSWIVDTSNLTDGVHKITITATSDDGETVSKEVDVTVSNQAAIFAPLSQSGWIPMDMAFLAIIGFIALVGVTGLRSTKKWR